MQLIDFKRLPDKKLDMHLYFRSWDLFALPYNLIGLSYFFDDIGIKAGLDVSTLYVYSSGLNVRNEMIELCEKCGKYLQIF